MRFNFKKFYLSLQYVEDNWNFQDTSWRKRFFRNLTLTGLIEGRRDRRKETDEFGVKGLHSGDKEEGKGLNVTKRNKRQEVVVRKDTVNKRNYCLPHTYRYIFFVRFGFTNPFLHLLPKSLLTEDILIL